MDGPCPFVDFLIHQLLQTVPHELYELEKDQLIKLRLNHRNNNWKPVLNTRAFIALLDTNWLIVHSLCDEGLDGGAEADVLLHVGWPEVESGMASRFLDDALAPSRIIMGDHKLKGSPRNLHQLLVERAKRHTELVTKAVRLADLVQALLQNKLIWPPLPLAEAFADVLVHVQPSGYATYVAYVRQLFSITEENKDQWQTMTTASRVLS